MKDLSFRLENSFYFLIVDDDEKIRKCILSGFFANVAKYHPLGEYRFVTNSTFVRLQFLSLSWIYLLNIYVTFLNIERFEVIHSSTIEMIHAQLYYPFHIKFLLFWSLQDDQRQPYITYSSQKCIINRKPTHLVIRAFVVNRILMFRN